MTRHCQTHSLQLAEFSHLDSNWAEHLTYPTPALLWEHTRLSSLTAGRGQQGHQWGRAVQAPHSTVLSPASTVTKQVCNHRQAGRWESWREEIRHPVCFLKWQSPQSPAEQSQIQSELNVFTYLLLLVLKAWKWEENSTILKIVAFLRIKIWKM